MMTTVNTTLNGFDLEAIENTVGALKSNPKIAEFKFKATNKWESGPRNTSQIQGFYGACQDDTTRVTPFECSTDMPIVLDGTDVAPSPPEFLLHTLASCMTTSMMLLASANGIKVADVTIRVEGDLNLNGFLGLDACILKEYEQIKVSIDVEGDLSETEKQELLTFAKKSPIYNTILNPGAINVSLHA
ncbi:OsmC family protein [Flavivirga spongiicola]|uniref:OsmC family protein n=1 Tax=Flavivirga spongiicola TaxID=421621 RepID=A0ABU7XXI4_9FLAO|nr:OsmC family protein [Flavivirga sp. MEBiC05379]MDO5980248.1 OsmC family protein [Flavivirga sp. MEBiC05379]